MSTIATQIQTIPLASGEAGAIRSVNSLFGPGAALLVVVIIIVIACNKK